MIYFFPFVLLIVLSDGRGVGHEWRQPCAIVEQLGVSWYYDWTSAPKCGTETLEAVPMLRKAGDWSDKQGGNSQWLLLANEPDLLNQADIPADQWASEQRIIEALFPNKLLVSPAPSQYHPEWLAQSRDAYSAMYGEYPRWDALAIHCYLPGNCERVVGQIIEYAAQWGAEVWVTEFAVNPCAYDTMDEAIAEVARFMAWMRAQSTITRWAWFGTRGNGISDGACSTPLVGVSGVLTEFGRWYAEGN